MPDVPDATASHSGPEILKRFGTSRESVSRLAKKAAAAEVSRIRIHGVSVSLADPAPHDEVSVAERTVVEQHFRVHDTPASNDPLHKTVELPKPVTQEVADLFNKLFGRGSR